MEIPDLYNSAFYEDRNTGSIQSAEVALSWLLEIVPCRSAVDIGCGTGTWLSVLRQNGVDDVIGLDGSYVETQQLKIPSHLFSAHDLEKPLCLTRQFDLALSLEVAEHLTPQRAASFVEELTHLAPIILFSAAIPHQGGTHHVNEQWPVYWANLFEKQGYVACDYLRPKVWDNPHIDFWYAQNMMLYVQAERLTKDETLHNHLQDSIGPPRALVHPALYRQYVNYVDICNNPSLKKCITDLPKVFAQAFKRRFAKPSFTKNRLT